MARDFNGSSDKINFGDTANLNPQLSMTVAAWINTDSTSGEASILSRGRAGVNGFNFQRVSGSQLRISKHSVVDIDSTSINLSTGWTLVAAVVQSTLVRFHKIPIGSTLTSQNVNNNQNFVGGSSESRMGSLLNSSGTDVNFWDGRIAEVAKWNRELSDAEITLLGSGQSPLQMPTSLTFYSTILGRFGPEPDIYGASGTLTGTSYSPHPSGLVYPFHDTQSPNALGSPKITRRKFFTRARSSLL